LLAGAARRLAAAGVPVLAVPPFADVVYEYAAEASSLRIADVSLGRPGRILRVEFASDVTGHGERVKVLGPEIRAG
jgi:hypothetical protein